MMKDKHKLTIFFLCLIAYSGAYLCRLNFSAAMPEMSASNTFSAAELGVITSIFFMTYGLGQLLNGFLGDKIPPRYMLFVGLILSGIANLLIMFFHSYHIMTILWGLNGLAQSMLWPPIIFMIGNYYELEEKNKIAKYFSVSAPIGTLLSYGFSMLWLKLFGWTYVFMLNGIIVLFIAAMWFIFSPKSIKALKANAIEKANENKIANEKIDENEKITSEKTSNSKTIASEKNNGFAKSLVVSGLIFMLIPVAIHGALKDSVTNWVPTFVVEIFKTETNLSLLLTMILPIVNVTGGFLASMLNEKIKNEALTSGIFFIVAIVASMALLFFGKSSIVLSIICLAILTNSMFAVNLLTISVMPLRFARFNKVSFVSGLVNSVAYIGCAVVNMFVGFLLHAYSWSGVMLLWVCLAAFACIVSFGVSFMWKNFSAKERRRLY